jgi:hypothetical protein
VVLESGGDGKEALQAAVGARRVGGVADLRASIRPAGEQQLVFFEGGLHLRIEPE